jgi:hypothetical protein
MTEDLNIKEDLIVEGNIYGKNGIRYNITAGNIDAGNITAGNIDAGNIDAGNITALDIDAWDINALNINARDINYFAVCFAYKNINCKSIEGRRENCKHFVLDGEIKIEKDIPEFIEKDGYKYKLVENEE